MSNGICMNSYKPIYPIGEHYTEAHKALDSNITLCAYHNGLCVAEGSISKNLEVGLRGKYPIYDGCIIVDYNTYITIRNLYKQEVIKNIIFN